MKQIVIYYTPLSFKQILFSSPQNIISTIFQTRQSDDLKSPGFLQFYYKILTCLPFLNPLRISNIEDSYLSFYTRTLFRKSFTAKLQKTCALNLLYEDFHLLPATIALKFLRTLETSLHISRSKDCSPIYRIHCSPRPQSVKTLEHPLQA